MKLRRRLKHKPELDRWVAFALPAAVRRALAQADYPLDPLKLAGSTDTDDAIRRIARLDAAVKRRVAR